MTTQQPEALQCAADLEYSIPRHRIQDAFILNAYKALKMVRTQHARIADLEAQLEAIGAGGVSGPLIGQPQAMPDLSQLTERGAKAWAGVDAQGLREGGADMSKERDDLTAFYAWLHTYESEVGALDDGSARVGFIAGRASLQPPGFTAADMATVSAQGFRDGVASVSAGSEPVAEIGSAAGDCAAFGERALYPLVDIDRFDYGTKLYTHPSPPEGMAGWQPIETASKYTEHGIRQHLLLGYAPDEIHEDGFVSQGYWMEPEEDAPDNMGHDGGWVDVHFDFFSCGRSFGAEAYRSTGTQPTHWQPLPAAPGPADGESNG